MENSKNTEGTKPLFEPIEGTLEFAVRVTDSDISASILYPQKLLDLDVLPPIDSLTLGLQQGAGFLAGFS